MIKMFILSFCSVSALSQDESDKKGQNWDIYFTTGGLTGGPCNDINEFLVDAGYDYKCYPKNRLPVVFGIYREINDNLRLGININLFDQDLKAKSTNYDFCGFKTVAISPLISYDFRNYIFFDAGPSFNSISYSHSTNSSLNDDEKYLNLGFTLRSSFEFPKAAMFYLRIEMQYCYGGKIDANFSFENGIHQYAFTTIHADNLPMNYFYYGIGIGLRL